MTVATKTVSKTNKTVKVTTPKVSKQEKDRIKMREMERQRRINEKVELLERHSTSQDLFEQLAQEIRTLSEDESSHDLSVGDDYNFGVEYDIDVLLELIRDLRWFTRYIKEEDDDSITEYELDYIRPYFQD